MFTLGPEISLLLRRGVRRGLRTLRWDRGTGGAVAALAGAAFLAQLLVVLFLGAVSLQRMLRTQTDLHLEILPGAGNQESQAFSAAVRDLPFVERALYITKEQAYEEQRQKDPELVAFLEEYQLQNPFPDTISITLASLDDYDAFARFVRHEEWGRVVDPAFLSQVTNQERRVYALLQVTTAGRLLVLFFLMLLGGVTFFMLAGLVRSRASGRRDEVLVERLAGAPLLGCVLPFAVEAGALLSAALASSILFILLFLWMMPALVPALLQGGAFEMLRTDLAHVLRVAMPILFVLELLTAAVLASLGAWFGLRPWQRATLSLC